MGGGRDTTRQNVILAITRGRLHYRSDAIYFSKCSGRGADRTKGRRGCVCVVSGRGGQEEEEARQTSAMVEKRLSQASWSATALTSERDQQRSEGKKGE